MSATPTVADMMEAYSLDAVDHAKKAMGIDLDFSLESVKLVEQVLSRMYEEKPKGLLARVLRRAPSHRVVSTFSKVYGGYIGEVLRRQSGGEWFLDKEVLPGQVVIGLQKDDSRIWPSAKVGKRLTNGAEDNVWSYFQVVSERW